YKWKFRVPVGFQPSSSFTHLHQIKAVGGDDDDPLFVLTARKGSPNKMELNYYVDSNLSSEKLTSVNLSLFEGNWVEVTERVKIRNIGGSYSIEIKNVSTSATILSYSNNNILTFRADNAFIRPKWGIYRSLNSPADLRDETVHFNGFSIEEEQNTATIQLTDNDKTNFSVYQNPVSGKLIIDLFSKQNNQQFQIINLNGQVIKSIFSKVELFDQKQKFEVDISNLNKGIYFVRSISTNYIGTSKFIIT
ncbi:MAG TPA: T9SS type A sorting domain-containing protein, partial [Paludibacter sp.]|nr:T9SS type A sorting domain-containing protein [Paludibacter sp.]